ncbi:DUF460 domain-containing protein [Methanohalophilus sp.]|uniref:DUF460 domain-containing protein n=1 Tax=Methanohalophilus sp. TaxID=1966352 RepID=UPI00263302F8|nr:DUF460 domain-containing protein [Methanohalophilus sp.]MDK2892053.1 uncharacterized protein [Methanohalophilus sp.]
MNIKSRIIYGIDIARGSSRSKQAARYALVILDNNSVSYYTMISLHRILRMVRRDIPSIIAVDNIFELAPDKKGLVRILDRLPSEVKLVQVTGGMKQEGLLHLAKKHGFTFDPKDPVEEAEICARLADMGVGCEVLLFEDITRIKVSRSRSLGRGGWSQNRYRRKVHGAVKVKSREIEAILKKASKERKFTFTTRAIEGFGGYVSCEFIVHAKRSAVPVTPYSGSDVQVKITSVVGDKIRYKELQGSKRVPTIVGIDPGTTVGIAILSLDGDLLHSGSYRGISFDEIVKLIAEYGNPAVVASDVFPMPDAVERVRRSFSAVAYSPGTEIPADEKIAMARPYNYSNDHERDSLTAALFAYKKYKSLLQRVDRKTPLDVDRTKVKLKVIQGLSIGNAIEQIRAENGVLPAHVSESGEVRKDEAEIRNLVEKLKRKIAEVEELQEYIRELKAENESKESKIRYLENKIKKMRETNYAQLRKEKEIRIRNEHISRLKKEVRNLKKNLSKCRQHVKRLRQIKKMESTGEGIPVKVISSFTAESIKHISDLYGLKTGDVVFLKDPSGGSATTAAILADVGLRAVIVPDGMSHAAEELFFEKNVPLLHNLDIEVADDFGVVAPDTLEEALKEWEEYAAKRRHEKEEKELHRLVDEYRSERRRRIV